MFPFFLVTGATGHQGGATARELLARNVTVHALVRDPSSLAAQELQRLGCILCPGSYDDVPAITTAVAGAKGVFLNTMPSWDDPDAEVRQAKNVITAAVAAHTVDTVVVTTAFHAGRRSGWEKYGLGELYAHKAAVEDAVREAGFQHCTILRPAWLMHNYLPPFSQLHFPELKTEATLATAYESKAVMPHFDSYDVGKFAAAALLDPARFDGEEIELGNENLTIEQVAELLREASGKEVRVRYRGVEEIREMTGKVPTQGFQLAVNKEDLSVDAGVLEKYGIPLTTFAQYLERNKEQLLKAVGAVA